MIEFARKSSAEASTISEVRDRLAEPLSRVEEELMVLFQEDNLLLNKVYNPLRKNAGKRLRPILLLLAAECFTSELNRVTNIAAGAELVHTATLVHDDVVDRSTMRRGTATLNSTWGNKVAVLVGDSLFTKGLDVLIEERNYRLLKSVTTMFTEMGNGEILQILNYFNPDVTFTEYIERIKRKTALFMAFCCEAGAVLGAATEEEIQALQKYGLNVGLAFQIADDLLDFVGTEAEVGKPVGSDLREGNVTLPVIHALQTDSGPQIRELIKADEITAEDVGVIVTLLEKEHSLEYAFSIAENYVEEAIAFLDVIPESRAKQDLIKIAWYTLHRQN